MLLKICFHVPFCVIGDGFWFSLNFYFHLAQWQILSCFFYPGWCFRRIRIQNLSLLPGLCCGSWWNLSLMTVSAGFVVRDCFALHQSFFLGLQWAGILYKICIPASRAVCLKSLKLLLWLGKSRFMCPAVAYSHLNTGLLAPLSGNLAVPSLSTWNRVTIAPQESAVINLSKLLCSRKMLCVENPVIFANVIQILLSTVPCSLLRNWSLVNLEDYHGYKDEILNLNNYL